MSQDQVLSLDSNADPPTRPSTLRRRVHALSEISRFLVSQVDYEQALAAAIEKTAEVMDSTTGAFLLYEEDTGMLAVQKPAFGLDDEEFMRAYRVSLDEGGNAVSVFLSGEPYLTNDFQHDPRMNQRIARMSTAQRVMTVPLQIEGRSIGVFHVQDKRSGDFTREDLELLRLMAPTLAALITSAGMMRDLRTHRRHLEATLERRKHQLERAARIQRSLLPQTTPELRGYELAAACLAADDVAGDLFDWFMPDDCTLVFTVADVMGKGIAASLVMASLRAALRAAPSGLGPAARMRLAEKSMALHVGDDCMFVTAFHGQLDLRSRELRYVDAGHGHCQVRDPTGRLRELARRSLPMGVEPDQAYLEGRVRLQPGQTLIVHSDGLVESEGESRRLSCFSEELEASQNARDMVRRLLGRMPFSPPDDVTVLVLRCLVPEGAPGCGESQLVTTGGGTHGGR